MVGNVPIAIAVSACQQHINPELTNQTAHQKIMVNQNIPAKTADPKPVINTDGKVAAEVQELWKITGVPVSSDDDLKTYVNLIQKAWFQRSSGKERSEFTDDFKHKKSEILAEFDKLGWRKAIKPIHQKYDDVYIPAAKAITVQGRINYLVKLYNEGLRFDRLIVLTGQRDLAKGEEDAYLNQGLKTETQMVENMWDKYH